MGMLFQDYNRHKISQWNMKHSRASCREFFFFLTSRFWREFCRIFAEICSNWTSWLLPLSIFASAFVYFSSGIFNFDVVIVFPG